MPTADFNEHLGNGAASFSPYGMELQSSTPTINTVNVLYGRNGSGRCYNTYSLYEQQSDLSYDSKLATISALKVSWCERIQLSHNF